jgi:hypothetical protein
MLKSFKVGSKLGLSSSESSLADRGWKREVDDKNISSEDSEALESHITPSAFQKLQNLPQTLKFLLLITRQQFCHTPMYFCNLADLSFKLEENKSKRRKYEKHFQTVKELMGINGRIQQKQISGELPQEHMSCMNIGFLFHRIKGEQKAQGYCTYYKIEFEDIDGTDTECMVVYYHKSLKMCVMVITQPKVFVTWKVVTDHIISTTTILPFHKDCTFCGRCAENLTTCNDCKVVRYCGKTCQTSHWDEHKLICRKRKAKLSQQETVKSKLLSTNPFFLWKQLSVSSRPQQETESGSQDFKDDVPFIQAGMSMVALEQSEIDGDGPVEVEDVS